MNLADLLKKNIVMVPVVASVLVGTFTGVKYVVNLTDTINANKAEIEKIQTVDLVNIQRDMKVLTDGVNTVIAKLERAEGTWEMAENLYEVLADKVRQMEYDIKDLNREINYLSALNPKIKNLKKEKFQEIAKNSIIKEKIKELEIKKYVKNLK